MFHMRMIKKFNQFKIRAGKFSSKIFHAKHLFEVPQFAFKRFNIYMCTTTTTTEISCLHKDLI